MKINNIVFIAEDKIISYSIDEKNTEKILTFNLDSNISVKELYKLLKTTNFKKLIITDDNDEILLQAMLNRMYVNHFSNSLIFKIGEELQ